MCSGFGYKLDLLEDTHKFWNSVNRLNCQDIFCILDQQSPRKHQYHILRSSYHHSWVIQMGMYIAYFHLKILDFLGILNTVYQNYHNKLGDLKDKHGIFHLLVRGHQRGILVHQMKMCLMLQMWKMMFGLNLCYFLMFEFARLSVFAHLLDFDYLLDLLFVFVFVQLFVLQHIAIHYNMVKLMGMYILYLLNQILNSQGKQDIIFLMEHNSCHLDKPSIDRSGREVHCLGMNFMFVLLLQLQSKSNSPIELHTLDFQNPKMYLIYKKCNLIHHSVGFIECMYIFLYLCCKLNCLGIYDKSY